MLGLIARVAQAARAAGLGVSVCGDAAADPRVLPLLVGLGVRTFSVPAARVPQVGAGSRPTRGAARTWPARPLDAPARSGVELVPAP